MTINDYITNGNLAFVTEIRNASTVEEAEEAYEQLIKEKREFDVAILTFIDIVLDIKYYDSEIADANEEITLLREFQESHIGHLIEQYINGDKDVGTMASILQDIQREISVSNPFEIEIRQDKYGRIGFHLDKPVAYYCGIFDIEAQIRHINEWKIANHKRAIEERIRRRDIMLERYGDIMLTLEPTSYDGELGDDWFDLYYEE